MEICCNNTTINRVKDLKDVRNSRPIVLTNILCKIFEKNDKQEIDLVPREGKIDEGQFSFRKWKTIDAILKKTTKILDGFRRKGYTIAIFFNIKQLQQNQQK